MCICTSTFHVISARNKTSFHANRIPRSTNARVRATDVNYLRDLNKFSIVIPRDVFMGRGAYAFK